MIKNNRISLRSKIIIVLKNNINLRMLLDTFACIFFISYACLAQQAINQSSNVPTGLTELNSIVTIIASIITILGAIFGIPLYILNFRKTRTELDKLRLETKEKELEVNKKKRECEISEEGQTGKSRFNLIDIKDPDLIAPLFVFLNYIIASIISNFMNYGVNILYTTYISVNSSIFTDYQFLVAIAQSVVIALISLVLYVPLIKEGNKVKKERGKTLIPAISILLNFIIALSIINIINDIFYVIINVVYYVLDPNRHTYGFNLNLINVIDLAITGIITIFLLAPILIDAYRAKKSI